MLKSIRLIGIRDAEWGEDESTQISGWKKTRGKSHFEDLEMDGRMLLKCILQIGQEAADRIQDKNRCRGVVIAINLTLMFLYSVGNYSTS